MLPTDANYNFKGVLDDLRIYDYMLLPLTIAELNDIQTSIEEDKYEIPVGFSLEQNYPNPFNPSTTIEYTIPNVETGYIPSLQHVTLKVYDILGREIATLVNEQQAPGKYSVHFNVAMRHGASLPSGIYFYTLRVGDSSSPRFYRDSSELQIRKMVLIK
ncbi:MAG: T9SS type A sorting domain-containing protein [Ignavibacteriales bacterium]|nr:T9SS type A sorting domain-containing protein [Ignavibacteriales bacterium]